MSVLSTGASSSPWAAPPLSEPLPLTSSSPSLTPSYSSPLPFLQSHLESLINPPSSPSPPLPRTSSPSPVSSPYHVLQHLVAGGVAGSVARTVVAPLDRVKMLMQTQYLLYQLHQRPPSTTSPLASAAASLAPIPPAVRTLGLAFPTSLLPSPAAPLPGEKYHRMLQSMRVIVAEEGVSKLWKGNLLNITRVFPYSAIQFSSYDAYKVALRGDSKAKLSPLERLTAGALAGMTATSLTHPMDVVRLRLSIHRELNGVGEAFRHVWQEGGVRALFKGFIPTMLSVSPFIAINFASFDLLKQRVPVHSNVNILLLGAASGLLAQSVCYPLDTVRRRQQMKGRHYDGVVDAFRQIVKAEGVRGLYRGMVPNAVKVVPNNAIRFVVFEAVKKHMGLGGQGSGASM